MNCEFIYQDGIYKCQKCGFSLKSDKVLNLRRNCSKDTLILHQESSKMINQPNLISMAKGVINAVINYINDGTVSQEEQQKRMDICKICEHFEAERCKLCGCYMRYKQVIKNEKCPDGKW